MSFNVLVVPEDFRKDEHILRPIVQEMVGTFRKQARVRICHDPRLGGISEALKWSRIEAILDRYRGLVHCFILIVDRDGKETRRERLNRLEEKARELLGGEIFFAENAWQEIEVWALAGMNDLPAKWSWAEIRREPDSKEVYFEPYVEMRGLAPGGSRKKLGREAAVNYARIRKLCREDVEALELRLKGRFG